MGLEILLKKARLVYEFCLLYLKRFLSLILSFILLSVCLLPLSFVEASTNTQEISHCVDSSPEQPDTLLSPRTTLKTITLLMFLLAVFLVWQMWPDIVKSLEREFNKK
jgi:hypothetical protein